MNTFPRNQKKSLALHWVVGIALVAIAFIGAEVAWRYTVKDSASFDSLLASRTIVEYEQRGDIVAYTYLGDPLPENLVENEAVHLRTESSYSREVVRDDETVTMEVISYSHQTFVRDVFGAWHYLEHATTTRDAFLKRSAVLYLAHKTYTALVKIAYAVTDTFFSNTGGDGHITGNGFTTDIILGVCLATAWADARNSTTGAVSSAATTMVVGGDISSINPAPDPYECTANIKRIFVPFDTSSIPSSATITAADVNVYVTAKSDQDNDGTDYITVVRTSQATHTALASTDYDNITTTEGVDTGQRKDITSITTSAYLVFTLNATGLGWIAKSGVASNCSASTGISCFGLREGHDNANATLADGATNTVTVSSTDATGTTQDPYLSVTYTVPLPLFHDVIWFD